MGHENYKKLDHLTVGLGQMDAVAAMQQPNHEVIGFRDAAIPLYRARDAGCAADYRHEGDSRRERHHRYRGDDHAFPRGQPELYKVLHAALKEAMQIIATDKGRAVDGYIGATGDRKTSRDMLLKIANDPDVEFTMTPRAMKSYADFMYKTGTIKARLPESGSFFSETAGLLNGS